MIEKQFKIIAGTGFARPACLLVSYASTFKAKIVLEYKGVTVNLKDSSESIMNVMSLGIMPGSCFNIWADGCDELDALQTIESSLSKTHLTKSCLS